MASIVETQSVKERRKAIFQLVWPATMESLLQYLVGLLATAMVGRLGAVAISATGLSNRVVRIPSALALMVTVGVTILIAQAIGAKRYEKVANLSYQALAISIIMGTAITLIGFVYAGDILAMFNAEEGLHEVATNFLRIAIWSIPFTLPSMTIGAALRGAGNTKTAMYVALVVNVVNVGIGYILIFGFGPVPALGVYGAAISLVIAQFVGLIVACLAMFHPNSPIQLRTVTSRRLSFPQITEIISLGFPASAESLLWQAATIVLTVVIVRFGTVALAAHQLGLEAEGLSYMPSIGLGVACTTLVGQALGARDRELTKFYVREVLTWTILLTIVTGGILLLFPRFLLGLLTSDGEVIALGSYYLILMGLIQVPQQATAIFKGAFRGAKDTKTPMLIALFGIWVIRIPLAFLLGENLGMGVIGVWIAITTDVFIRFLVSLYYFRKHKWLEDGISANSESVTSVS